MAVLLFSSLSMYQHETNGMSKESDCI